MTRPILYLYRNNGSTIGNNTVAVNGDMCGQVIFGANDGSEFVNAASISVEVDGTPGANDMPGRLVFSVTGDGSANPTERMRIDSSGRLLVGTSSATGANLLQVNSDALVYGLTVGRGGGAVSGNTAVGASALAANTTAADNTAIGDNALRFNTAADNVAVGHRALYTNTSGTNNVAAGYRALYTNSVGSYHVALGFEALYSATDNNNTAVGYRAGRGATNGHSNVFIGSEAGYDTVLTTTGQGLVYVGRGTRGSAAGNSDEIVIGRSCNGLGNDYVALGKLNARVYNHFDTNATWIQASDLRLKTNIQNDRLGLKFINKLRPVTYCWKATNDLELDNPQYNEVNNKNTEAVMHGLIAQEVKLALDEEDVSTFGGWHIEPNGIQGISREMFTTPLINAVQELTAMVRDLQAELSILKGS